MARYAEGTSVPAERSQQQIVAMLRKYGATRIATGWDSDRTAIVGFEAHNRQIRFVLPLPDPDSPEFWQTPTGRDRTTAAANAAREQEIRRRWRALYIAIQAKLEAVATGIAEFESEFLAYTVLPDGRTVAEHAVPAVQQAYATGLVPPLLPRAIEGPR